MTGSPQTFSSGRYTVIRELGRGGQKVVYLVHDAVLDRQCALSLIEADNIAADEISRLRHEALSLAKIGSHPNIVTIHDLGDEAGRPFIVAEYVAGGDLAAELRRAGGPLPIARALEIGRHVLRALVTVHGCGVIHRDLKPSNVWITNDGAAKLGDFGLALATDRSRLTVSNTVTGTPSYVSPEQLENHALDGRSDLYSFGCLLYELTTGRPPFVGPVVSVISQHLHARPVAPSKLNAEVAPELDELILSLLAKAPADRPASAVHALERLGAPPSFDPVSIDRPVHQKPTSLSTTPPPRRLAVPILAAIATVGMALIYVVPKSPAPTPEMHRIVIVPTRDPGQTVSSTFAWALASRMIEVVDRYREFRPISHAGTLAARLAVLESAAVVPDETMALEIAERLSVDTVAALAVAPHESGDLTVAVHVFATGDPASGVSTMREPFRMADLDADGPARLGAHIARALARQWGYASLVDETGGMPETQVSFDAFKTYIAASEFCIIGRYDQCEERAKRALEMSPDNALFHSIMACALSYQGGRENEAWHHVEKALELSKTLTSRHHRLHAEGETIWVAAEKDRANGDREAMRAKALRMVAMYEELIDVWMDPFGHLYAGAVHQYFLDDIGSARRMYALARTQAPMLYPAYYEEAKLLHGDGKNVANDLEAARLLWTFIECNPTSELVPVARTHVREWSLPRPAELPSCHRIAGAP